VINHWLVVTDTEACVVFNFVMHLACDVYLQFKSFSPMAFGISYRLEIEYIKPNKLEESKTENN
jgi:hypothetical protein